MYQANETAIPLQQELDYVRRYAQLAQLRRPASLNVALDFPGQWNGAHIPPLLLLPLVENAFKYVRREGGQIEAGAQMEDGRFRFRVTNNKEAAGKNSDTPPAGGIGLTNLRKRLQLLYPNAHNLTIDDRNDQYAVDLTLTLEEQ